MKFRTLLSRSLAALLMTQAVTSLVRADEWALTGDPICHDPTLIKEGDTYYLFYTGKGLPWKSSKDGLHWTLQPKFFKEELSWWREYAPKMDKIDIWAPDLHQFGGRFWLYYSVSEFGKNNSAIGLMSCSSLAKADWKDEGLVLGSKAGKDPFNAIDPNLVVDVDGKPWMVWGSWFSGICLTALNPETMKPQGPIHTLAAREAGTEGPCIVHKDGWYYLFLSIDRCCQGVKSDYKMTVGRSRSITGPYVDKAGEDMLKGACTVLEVGGERYKGPGGQSVCQIDGKWVVARHAYDSELKGEPVIRLADLYFDAEGWPTLSNPAAKK